jgi:HTH-type transcriptional regulator / antitoxin HipB
MIVPISGVLVVPTFPEALGAEVRARRTTLKLNQQDVADMAGVSERFVRFVEQGKPSIQLDSLLAVLETLGLELKLATRSREAAHALVPQPPPARPSPQPPPARPSPQPPPAVPPSSSSQAKAEQAVTSGAGENRA